MSTTTNTAPRDSFARLAWEIATARDAVVNHPVYARLGELPALRVFMTSHAFTVWDFMSLLKTLQRRLTCVEVPWLPSADAAAGRLVNEIVLGEETDEIAPGRYTSHYDLYLVAMKEIGADSGPIRDFVGLLARGVPAEKALADLPVPASTKKFVLGTLHTCRAATPEVAASFLLGREDLVPAMFRTIITELESRGTSCASFRLYLDRHVQLDEERHGPMAKKLLQSLCGEDPQKWREATEVAQQALGARRELWDGVLAAIETL
ncbi:MAG: DUF3050 domain-containing protein [Candidatus Polarisedimenticolia bacterium]